MLLPMMYSDRMIARFWAKVDRRGPDECWPWTASLVGGYGQLFSGKSSAIPTRAHVMSWCLVNGPLPDGHWVLHTCDNPPCCNPRHLYHGTRQNNIDDMMSRNRHGRSSLPGSKNPNALMTEDVVREIRRRLSISDTYNGSKKILAEFGITKAMLYSIRHNKAWRHVTLEQTVDARD
jgi:HNH endonuclease